MKYIIRWADGVEESRDFDEYHEEAPNHLTLKRVPAADDAVGVLAGRRLDGAPIYYEDTSLIPQMFGHSIRLWDRRVH